MNKIVLSLTTAALALGGAGVALADHHGGMAKPDTDGDGAVSLAEHNAHAAAMFARMDANGDGVINTADREAKKAERFAAMDTNGDGELSQAEMKAMHEARMAKWAERRAKRAGDTAQNGAQNADRAAKRAERAAAMFERLDTDNSGGLSQAEMAAGREMRHERRAAMAEGARADGAKADGKRHGGWHRGGGMGMMKGADTNGDGNITRAEFDAAAKARFDTMDADSSGSITAEERTAAREARKAQWQARRSQQ